MLPPEFEQIVAEIIAERGGQILNNFDLCSALLKDKAEGQYTPLIKRFVEALRLLVHQRINTAGDIELTARQQIEILKTNYFPEDLSFDIVALLCELLRNHNLEPTQKVINPPQIQPRNGSNSKIILDFLRQHPNNKYCDDCLSELCNVKPRQQVNQICNKRISTQIITQEALCSNCGHKKLTRQAG